MTPMKTERFELRLTPLERDQLKTLAERRGISMSDLVASMIRRAAARAKI